VRLCWAWARLLAIDPDGRFSGVARAWCEAPEFSDDETQSATGRTEAATLR
jgi:hypothetical protein